MVNMHNFRDRMTTRSILESIGRILMIFLFIGSVSVVFDSASRAADPSGEVGDRDRKSVV